MLSECVWMLRRAGKGLEKKFGRQVNSLEKWAEVFAVDGSGCGGGDG